MLQHLFTRVTLLCFAISIHVVVNAQQVILPFDRVSSPETLGQLYAKDSVIHFAFKPLRVDRRLYNQLLDSTQNRYGNHHYKSWWGRKFFQENLAIVDTGDLYFTIDPVLNLEIGQDLNESDKQITTNTRGVLIQGNITEKVFFRTDFYETQSYFPSYLDSVIAKTGAVPGQGKAKSFKTGGYDYPVVTGIVNVQAHKNFSFQFGHDKLFVGNGYRSLLLSDNSAPYLFLQLATNLFENKLQYHANWASLQMLQSYNGKGGDQLFRKKQANFNYLSFKPNSKIEIGAFEGVMWERWNEQQQNIEFDPVFLNPVPFLTTAIKQNDTLVNSVLGLNVFYKPLKRFGVYGQLSHGVQKGATGVQVGFKGFDVFHVEGLNAQAEFNNVPNNVYGTSNAPVDYYHYNQPLTVQHAEGFSEMVAIASYRYKRFVLYGKLNYAQVDNAIHKTTIQTTEGNLAYVMNPVTNLMVNAGLRIRQQENAPTTQWVYFGIKTNLRNLYYDY